MLLYLERGWKAEWGGQLRIFEPSLDSAGAEEMRPGEVRELAREEKEALFEASLPRLLSGEVSREHYREIEWDEEDV